MLFSNKHLIRVPLQSSWFLGVLFLFGLIIIRIYDPVPVQEIRNRGFDLLHSSQPRTYTPQPVRIVDIDEKSLAEFGQWPWPRTLIAKLIDQIASKQAVVIGFDMVFAEPDRYSLSVIARDNQHLTKEQRAILNQFPANEMIMREAIESHLVVLGETTARSTKDNRTQHKDASDTPFVMIGEDPHPFFEVFPSLVSNLPVLDEAAAGRGMFTVRTDRDGIIRSVPMVMSADGIIRFALSLETLRVATGSESYVIKTTQAGIDSIVVSGKEIKTDGKGRIWPYLTPHKMERYVSASSFLKGEVGPSALKGQIVLIGTSAAGLEDLRSTPLGQMPGVELHAQIIESLLQDQLLVRPHYSLLYELFFILIAGSLIIICIPRLGAIHSTVLGGICLAVVIGISWYAFTNHRLLLDATWPAVTLLTLFIVTSTLNYMREERQKRHIRSAFGQYLSPALVGRLSEHPDELVLGGETRELSILFSDIRGFTTISETFKDDPQGLTQLMNEFLTELSQPILDQNGTIDKYIGDAIMAFWNAPLENSAHAYHACQAALEMIENVSAINAKKQQEFENGQTDSFIPIEIGIGINTGNCAVGNMGSKKRFDYTALGDSVNTASRLEGQSKSYGVPIVLGPATAQSVMDTFAILEIDLIRVKGKNEPLSIYTLLGDKTLLENHKFQTLKASNATLLKSYRQQDWKKARHELQAMHEIGNDINLQIGDYVTLYETRIAEFMEKSPGPDWDGVFTATSK